MRPIKFIHTADVHLDTSFSGSGLPSKLGHRKREAIRAAFRRIIDDARKQEAELLLIAGDLFELERVTPDTFEFIKQQLAGAHPIRVFIAPGNHDPCVQGSPYREELWPENVCIFHTEEFKSIELPELGVRVTGFGFCHPSLEERLFQKLPALPDDFFNIVIAHASDLGKVPMGKSKHGPFTIEEIAGKNINYCALGHYHQQHRIENQIDATEVWYSGIPEGRGWDEEGACGYLLCEFSEGALKIDSRICNQYPLNTMEVACDAFSTREQAFDEIMRHKGELFDSKTILRIRLTGALDPRLDLSLPELEQRLADEVLHIQWDDLTCSALDFDSISQEKTIRGRFVRMLNERIASAPESAKLILERARLYGVQALKGEDVRLR
jgi:DNA repair exonuclease SbcCD nuclease subunit